MPYSNPESQAANARSHYQRNKAAYIARARNQREVMKQYVRDLKEASPCMDCGILYPFYVMEFDHVRGEKVENINRLVTLGNRARLDDEIAKCDLVCGNCHAIRGYLRLGGGDEI